MNVFRRILAVILITAICTISEISPIQAAAAKGNLFTNLFSGFDKKDQTSDKSSDVVIVLDAGHGGSDAGAAGNGLTEKTLTLLIAQYCKSELETYKGVKVYMTRTKDTYIGLNQRVQTAAKLKADILVSLHINSAENPDTGGAEVFYPNTNYQPSHWKEGRMVAAGIQKNLVALGLENRGIKTRNSIVGGKYKDGSTTDYYAIIRGAKKAGFPGIIVEHAFVSNETDARTYLTTTAALKNLAIADAKGIAASYGLKKSKVETLQRTELTKLVGQDSSRVYIKWDEVEGAEGYEVYRSSNREESYEKLATIEKGTSISYEDRSAVPGSTYYYKVRPFRHIGGKKETAGYSKAQKVRLLYVPEISVEAQSASRVKVSWLEVEGAVRYEIYRSSFQDKNYQKIATVKDFTTYKDTQLKSDSIHYYKVRAVANGIQGSTYSSYSTVKW